MDENYINRKLKSKKLGKYFPASEERFYKVKKLSNEQHLKSFRELTPVKLIGMLKHYIKNDENNASTTLRSFETMDKAIEAISQKHDEQSKSDKKQNLRDNYWAFIKNGIYSESKSFSAKYLPFYLLEYEYKFKRKELRNIFPQFMKNVFSEHTKATEIDSLSIKNKVAYA